MAQVIVTTTALSFGFPKIETDEQWTLDAASLKPEVIDYLFQYGVRQAVADRCSGMKRADYKSDEEFGTAIRDCVKATLKALADGSVRMGGGGGGARLSPVEVECRNLFVGLLTDAGVKKGDATKLATEWRQVIRDRRRQQAETTGADVGEAMKAADAAIASITAEAERLVKARGAAMPKLTI